MPPHAKHAEHTEHADVQQPAPAAIPGEAALRICAVIQAENRNRWYTANGIMCRACVKFSKGDRAKMCFANRPDNRGCYQVNARYDQQFSPDAHDARDV